MRSIRSWSAGFAIGSGQRQLSLEKVFIRLVLCADQVRARQAPRAEGEIGPEGLLVRGRHAVILGEPGAGKTTLFRHLATLQLALNGARPSGIFNAPLLIECRSLRGRETIAERLCGIFGIDIQIQTHKGKLAGQLRREFDRFRERVLCTFLSRHAFLLLIDGLDETSTEKRIELIDELSSLLPVIQSSTVLVTCRFRRTRFSNWKPLHAIFTRSNPFTDGVIQEFSQRWFVGKRKAAGRLFARH